MGRAEQRPALEHEWKQAVHREWIRLPDSVTGAVTVPSCTDGTESDPTIAGFSDMV